MSLSALSLIGPLQIGVNPGSILYVIPWSLVLLIVILLAIIALGAAARVVRPVERGLVERLGKYHGFANQGIRFLVPFIDRLVKVNITESMTHVEPQEIITNDKLVMTVDAVIFYKVREDEQSVKSSVYAVNDFRSQIEMLSRTTLRDIIGAMSMTEANVGREQINTKLKQSLESQSQSWGVEIMRAELKDLRPTPEIQESMNAVFKAENEKQAAINHANAVETEADGRKRAAIKEAEGRKQSAILAAEGLKQSAILESEGKMIALQKVAEGQANAIKQVNEAYQAYFKNEAVVAKQLDTIQEALKNNTKMIIPAGSTLSLILNEAEAMGKGTVIPIVAQQSPSSEKRPSMSPR